MVDFRGVKVAVGVECVEQHEAEELVGKFPGGEAGDPLKKAQLFLFAGELHQLRSSSACWNFGRKGTAR
jgi:hypothetical protein